jgi:hypothetical protein
MLFIFLCSSICMGKRLRPERYRGGRPPTETPRTGHAQGAAQERPAIEAYNVTIAGDRHSKARPLSPQSLLTLGRTIDELYRSGRTTKLETLAVPLGLGVPFVRKHLEAAEKHYGVPLITRREENMQRVFDFLPTVSRVELPKSTLRLTRPLEQIASDLKMYPKQVRTIIAQYAKENYLLFFEVPDGRAILIGKRHTTQAEYEFISGIRITSKREAEAKTESTRNFLRWCFCQGIPVEAGALAAYAGIKEATAERIISRVKKIGVPEQTGAPPAPKRGARKSSGIEPQDVRLNLSGIVGTSRGKIETVEAAIRTALGNNTFVNLERLGEEAHLSVKTVSALVREAERQIHEKTGINYNLTRAGIRKGSRTPANFVLQLGGRPPEQVAEIRRKAISFFGNLTGTGPIETIKNIALHLGVDSDTARSVIRQFENQTGIRLKIRRYKTKKIL